VDPEDIINGLVRGALSSRHKSYRRTHGALGGLVNARNILTAAGLAWGLYEAVASSQGRSAGSSPSETLPLPSAASPPAVRRTPGLSEYVVRLVRLTISAARSDGDLSLEERRAILEHARKVGAEAVVTEELQNPRPLAEIVSGVTDPALKNDLYTLAFAIVRADETVSGAERIYLAQLAHQLGLDEGTTKRLETEAGNSIDRA
jgi:uncharacterized membrane protein YebE (DUF533 family)